MIGLVLGKRSLDKLTPEQRAVVISAGKSATAIQRQVAGADVSKIISNLEKNGMKVNSPTSVEPFRKSVAPVYEKFRKSDVGPLLDVALSSMK